MSIFFIMNIHKNDIEVRQNDLYYIDDATKICFHFHCWELPTEFTATQFATILSLTSPAEYSTAQGYADEIEHHMTLNRCEGTFDCYTID